MKKFEDKFFKVLVSRYGFYIKDYFSSYKSQNRWIAISEDSNFAYCVIVCEKNEADICYKDATESLKSMIAKPIVLNIVIATATENLEVVLDGLGEYNKLVYSLKEERVVYSQDGCKPLIQPLQYIKGKEEKHANRFKDNKLTYFFIGINIIIFIITAMMSKNILNIDTYVLLRVGAKVNELINDGQVWRLFTSAFLHGGIVHLAFNMYALRILGPEVEYAYGRKKYLIIYILSALGGSACSYIFSPYSISVGASGAIFGLLGAMLSFGYKHRDKIGKSYMMNIIQVIIVNVIIGVSLNNIDNYAHFGGLIIGGLTALIVKNKSLINH